MGGKGSEDLVEILRITSANIIQELSDYYPPTLACYSTAKRMHTTSVPPSVKPALAGVSGGLVSTLLLHPLDTLKIRSAAGKGSCSQTIRILARAGAWAGLRGAYQGIRPNCTLSAFSWGLYFLSYESAKQRLSQSPPGAPVTTTVHSLAAMEAGIVTMALTNPLQVLRTRMVLCSQASSMGSFPLALVIVQREGFGAFFRSKMAALSAVKNKKAAKLREGIEDLAVRCGSNAQGEGVNVAQLTETLRSQNITLDDKEVRRLERASTDGKIPRADFVDYAKGSKAVKALLEKEGRPATPGSNRKNVKMDKAAAAFRAIDTDNSGFLDREEFLKFTSKMPERQQEKLLANLDKDGDGKIDIEEFRQLFNKK